MVLPDAAVTGGRWGLEERGLNPIIPNPDRKRVSGRPTALYVRHSAVDQGVSRSRGLYLGVQVVQTFCDKALTRTNFSVLEERL